VAERHDRPRELVVTALSRARFAEELGEAASARPRGIDLFLGGMLSVVDAMVGRPMREILDGLAVPAPVRAALTGEENPVGSVLRVVRAYEQGDWPQLEAARTVCPVGEQALNRAYLRSLEWAEATASV